jgi:hypothetical protein
MSLRLIGPDGASWAAATADPASQTAQTAESIFMP